MIGQKSEYQKSEYPTANLDVWTSQPLPSEASSLQVSSFNSIMKRFLRRRWRLLLPCAVLPLAWIALAEVLVSRGAVGHLHDGVASLPHHRAALVLGCNQWLSDGRPNLFFRHRMQAAADLFHAGKADYLILSGDNSRPDYDEPSTMREALIQLGVPEARLFRDYAGFSTLDSVARMPAIFGQDEFIIVSQKFHNERALHIARSRGLKATGFNARGVSVRTAPRTWLRERLARASMLADLWLFKAQPRFLGPPVPLTGPPS